MVSEKAKNRIAKELAKYPDKRSALLAAIHTVQEEKGWISLESMDEIASLLELKPIEVAETVSFYTMFNPKPVGKHQVQVCTNLSCSLLNSRHIVDYLQEKLEIKTGETRSDQKHALSVVECLGYCGTAPVMLVDDILYDNLTEEKVDSILESLN